MSKLKFSKEDIEKLKNNPYIFNITEKAITYADEFKEKFIELYNNGITPTEIFRKCEIPPEIIGQKRIDTFSYRVKQKIKDGKLLEDNRKGKSGRPKTKQLNKDEEIRQLKHKIKYQEQQIEFLKKISFVEKKAKWESSKKNTR